MTNLPGWNKSKQTTHFPKHSIVKSNENCLPSTKYAKIYSTWWTEEIDVYRKKRREECSIRSLALADFLLTIDDASTWRIRVNIKSSWIIAYLLIPRYFFYYTFRRLLSYCKHRQNVCRAYKKIFRRNLPIIFVIFSCWESLSFRRFETRNVEIFL